MTDRGIYLVRHGETAFNADGRLRGLADPDLNAAGLGQAKSLASALASAGTSIIVSSPLLRAVHTAAIIAQSCQTEHKVDVRFNDRDYGRWTGQPKTDVIAQWGTVDAAPGVEPTSSILSRARPARPPGTAPQPSMIALTWIGVVLIGGAGSVLRFTVDRAVARRFARAFPFGTLTVNLTGAAFLGVLTGLALPPTAVLLAGTAAVGSYTTFSTWMLEAHRLTEERQHRLAALNLIASIALGVAAAGAGQWIGVHL